MDLILIIIILVLDIIETINSVEIPYSSGAYTSGALASIYRDAGGAVKYDRASHP